MVCRVVALGAVLGHGTCADLPSARTVTEGCDLMAPGCVSPLLVTRMSVHFAGWVLPLHRAPVSGGMTGQGGVSGCRHGPHSGSFLWFHLILAVFC